MNSGKSFSTLTVDDGGPAFPVSGWAAERAPNGWPLCGMMLRDWFAGQALAGILANPNEPAGMVNQVDDAFNYADLMILRRNKLSKQ